jgi:hypothetical protein
VSSSPNLPSLRPGVVVSVQAFETWKIKLGASDSLDVEVFIGEVKAEASGNWGCIDGDKVAQAMSDAATAEVTRQYAEHVAGTPAKKEE